MTRKKNHYLGYFLHRGFGSSSTRHVILEDNGDGAYKILSKMDQFTTGAMTNVLPILDEIWSFKDARGLADFCFEYAFDPAEIALALRDTHAGLAKDFLNRINDDCRFGPAFIHEHRRVPADTDLIRQLVQDSGLAELLDAPILPALTGNKQGKVMTFPADEIRKKN